VKLPRKALDLFGERHLVGELDHRVPDHEHLRMPGLQMFQRLFRRPQLVRTAGTLEVFRCRAVTGQVGYDT